MANHLGLQTGSCRGETMSLLTTDSLSTASMARSGPREAAVDQIFALFR